MNQQDACRRESGAICPHPWIIGHRGASGYRPEHSASAYELAIRQGADAIEPDLVMSRDGVLIVRHDAEIGETTDVAARDEFANLLTTKTIDGHTSTGWFTDDFTAAQLRTLRTRERLPALRGAYHDGRDAVLTFDQLLLLRQRWEAQYGRPIGVVPEIKHAAYFRSQGLDVEAALVTSLRRVGLAGPHAPVWTESFEPTSLYRLRHSLGFAGRLVLLLDEVGQPADYAALGTERSYADLTTPAALREWARTVDAISPAKGLLIPRRLDGALAGPSGLAERAHRVGLQVFTWTVRAENTFLPRELRRGPLAEGHGDLAGEVHALMDAGVDAIFTDHVDLAVAARGSRSETGPHVPARHT